MSFKENTTISVSQWVIWPLPSDYVSLVLWRMQIPLISIVYPTCRSWKKHQPMKAIFSTFYTNVHHLWMDITGVYIACILPTQYQALNMMQAQKPLLALRIFHRSLSHSSPQADTFLRDGYYELLTLYMYTGQHEYHMYPDQDLFKTVFEDFNTLEGILLPSITQLHFI